MAKTKEADFKELAKNIDFNRLLLTIVPLLQPFIIFGAWLTFARMNTKASVVSKIIAICEPIPTIDLNVPKEVVVASMFDSIEDLSELVEKVMELVVDIPLATATFLKDASDGKVTVKTGGPMGDVEIDIKKEGGKYGEKLLNDIINALKVVI